MQTAATGPTAPPAGVPDPDPRPARPRRSVGRSGRAGPGPRDRVLPHLLLAPVVISLVGLLGWPLVNNLLISLRRLNLAELVGRRTVWVGFENYVTVLASEKFWTVLWRTVLFTAVNVVLTMVVGTLVALLLHRVGRAVRAVLGSSLVLAWAMPTTAATTVYQWLFDSEFGVVNWFLVRLGLDSFRGYSWFSTGTTTFAVIVVLIVWQAVPFVALSLYAGLTGIPGELYEAARVDGAGPLRVLRLITLPLLRPLLLTLTFLSVIWDFRVFTQVWAIRQGGPNEETTTLPVLVYQLGVAGQQFGVAAAASVVTVLVLLLAMVLHIRRTIRLEDEP